MEQKSVKKDFTVMELRRLKWLYSDGTKKGSTVMELKILKSFHRDGTNKFRKKVPQSWK